MTEAQLVVVYIASVPVGLWIWIQTGHVARNVIFLAKAATFALRARSSSGAMVLDMMNGSQHWSVNSIDMARLHKTMPRWLFALGYRQRWGVFGWLVARTCFRVVWPLWTWTWTSCALGSARVEAWVRLGRPEDPKTGLELLPYYPWEDPVDDILERHRVMTGVHPDDDVYFDLMSEALFCKNDRDMYAEHFFGVVELYDDPKCTGDYLCDECDRKETCKGPWVWQKEELEEKMAGEE